MSLPLRSFLIAAALMLFGCNYASPQDLDFVAARDLVNGPKGSMATTYRGLFYCGATDGYDIFCMRHDFLWTRDTLFRVSEQDSPIESRKPYSRSESNWEEVNSQELFPPDEVNHTINLPIPVRM